MHERHAPQSVHRVLATPGRPLDESTRALVAPRFAHDTRVPATHAIPHTLPIGDPDDAFEHEADRPGKRLANLAAVRVHTDSAAAESASEVHARAYTVGAHIVFGRGEFAPATDAGRRLLEHELAHVAQQSEGRVARCVQRSLTVADPRATAQNQPAGRARGAAPLTNAQLVQSWVDTLCGSQGWTVDATSGALSMPNRAAFCDTPPAAAGQTPAAPGFTRSPHPASCRCLCDITASGAPAVQLHVGDVFTAPGETAGTTERVDVRPEGQGATLNPRGARTGVHVGVSGRPTTVRGAGATVPISGTGRAQMIADPPWIIFAHEVCGHVAGPAAAPMSFFADKHVQSPAGTTSAVDIENRIRREHSTPAQSLGIRRGDMHVEDPADPSRTVVVSGSFVTPMSGDTLRTVAARFGIPAWRITLDIFRGEGDRYSGPDAAIAAGEILFIRGVFYHDVIAGETVESIARTWNTPIASLRRVNPTLPATGAVPAGTRLLVPAS